MPSIGPYWVPIVILILLGGGFGLLSNSMKTTDQKTKHRRAAFLLLLMAVLCLSGAGGQIAKYFQIRSTFKQYELKSLTFNLHHQEKISPHRGGDTIRLFVDARRYFYYPGRSSIVRLLDESLEPGDTVRIAYFPQSEDMQRIWGIEVSGMVALDAEEEIHWSLRYELGVACALLVLALIFVVLAIYSFYQWFRSRRYPQPEH